MTGQRAFAVAALPAALGLGLAARGVPRRAEEVRWRSDYAAAREEARAASRPLLVVFR